MLVDSLIHGVDATMEVKISIGEVVDAMTTVEVEKDVMYCISV
jgi:hypothetical protein